METWTLSELAALAEIIGLIAIIPSLIFVGVQLYRGNRETRAATIQSAINSELDMIATIAQHAGTWDKVMTGAPLESGEEHRRGILLFNLVMTESENRFHQVRSGYLDNSMWAGSLTSIRPVVSRPIFSEWRDTPGALNHSADFLAFVDSLAEEVSEEG